MSLNDKIDTLLSLLDEYKALGIAEQIDYNKFYLYSLITHSTAIEGSTVTEMRTNCFSMKESQQKVEVFWSK